jgi:subtilase family serine protease
MRASRLLSLLPLTLVLLAALPATPGAAATPKHAGGQLPQRQVEALVELKHPRGLNRFVRAVSDPSSRRYRQYATVERLVARFGAEERTKRRVLRWLAARGLRGVLAPTGTYVAVRLPRAGADRLLPRTGEATASGAGRERRVPAALRGAVERIAVLSAKPAVTRHLSAPDASAAAAAAAGTSAKRPYRSILRHSGSSSGCVAGRSGGVGPGFEPFTPNQYLTAYGHAAMHARGLRGEGQTAAVVETGGFRRGDIVAFGRCFGVKPPPIRIVPVAVEGPLAPEDETTLDLEMLSVGAPGLDRILVYEGPESLTGIALTAGSALGAPGHQPDVISISLGFCEPELGGSLVLRNAFDAVFGVAAAAGISVLVSAGDQGSSGCRVEDLESEEATALPLLAVSLPASSPYATAVGGTNLALSKRNRIVREIVWNDSVLMPWGGGGGGSIVSPRTPWWQARIDRYGPGRKVPDVAALADLFPGYAFFCTAKSCDPGSGDVFGWSSVGGTSAAAPLTAAGIALANQYAERRGQPNLGFLNPLLYRLGADAGMRRAAFNDVVAGDNDIGRALPPQAGGGRPVGCCRAKRGYDWASGWGSLKLPGLSGAAARLASR